MEELPLDFHYSMPKNPTPVYTSSTVSTPSINDSPQPTKKLMIAGQGIGTNCGAGKTKSYKQTMEGSSIEAAGKPKRVRTGCLTCRERHLKCDEGLPHCQNCRKSNRTCKRGVRLNFIDTQVKDPKTIPPTADWMVQFQDESREIASEYKGGLRRYDLIEQTITPPHEQSFEYPVQTMPANRVALNPILSPIQTNANYTSFEQTPQSRRASQPHSRTESESTYLQESSPTYDIPSQMLTPPAESYSPLDNQEKVLFMQVFVEEVGVWMDSMDSMKHFSRILPFNSLREPMLLNAFLACGARHLTLVNPLYTEDRALYYYDTATTQLLRSLQNPDRNTEVCATTAVILNVYEVMSERAMQRMNHIAGARALIKECQWNARSTGVGAACFWLNVGLEVLSCLHFNWQVAWEPDQWGLDMSFRRETETGQEEVWVHRMLFIIGKITNFRASVPRFQEASPHDEQVRLQKRYAEWQRLKNLCERWENCIPETMRPMTILPPSKTSSRSAFPEIWLIKRSTIIGRLFYHTAMTLLPQINPLVSKGSPDMHRMQQEHARSICGIVSHVKDRGVASVAIRSLAIASECLVIRREQEEVLEVFERIRKETGWRVGFISKELKDKWGWAEAEAAQQKLQAQQTSLAQFFPATSQAPQTSLPPAPPVTKHLPSGVLNPLLKQADFSLPGHPYQQFYQPPNPQVSYQQGY